VTEPFIFTPSPEAKRYAPATQRNRDSIVAVLRDVLPQNGSVLEIASGTGEHIVHFAAYFPQLTWLPSDFDPAGLDSIAAWSDESRLPNIAPPIQIDSASPTWAVQQADAIVCINMVHISPWEATKGLFEGASQLLPSGAPLYLYGPYIEADRPTASSNEAFDTSLRAANALWGLRTVDDVADVAKAAGFALESRITMPANNLSLIFRRRD
jgi:cyclopropane fatty-acyl-phospholipid synthase-like methyltransferase